MVKVVVAECRGNRNCFFFARPQRLATNAFESGDIAQPDRPPAFDLPAKVTGRA